MAKAIVKTVSPNANATPRNPIPVLGNAAARTAAPQPPNTNQKVPKNSADNFFAMAYDCIPASVTEAQKSELIRNISATFPVLQ